MSIIQINSFGGEMPSVSPRNLLAGVAQTNQNLLLSHNEFRPLSVDLGVASTASGTQTLHRMARVAGGAFNSNPATGWITSTTERSYVKGQIDDELTERTYFTQDDGSAKPRAIDVTGVDRVLGVPRPTKLVPVHTVVSELTSSQANDFLLTQAAYQIQQAISASVEPEADGRRSGTTIYAGPTTLTGTVFSDDARVASLGYSGAIWALWFPVPAARVAVLKAASMAEFMGLPDGSFLTHLNAIPWTARLNAVTLKASLLAVVQPAGSGANAGTPLFTPAQADSIVADLQKSLSVELLASAEKSQLEQLCTQYYNLLFNSVVINDGNDDEIWSIQRSISEVATRVANVTASIEAKMQAALAKLQTGTTITDVFHGMGDASGIGIPTTERIIDDRFYLATFVTDWGEESEPSEVSNLYELDQNDTISIPRPTLTTGESFAARNITKWRLYRSNVGTTTSSFQFVGEADVAVASFADTVKAASLGEVCPTITWLQPPYRMDAQSTTYPTPVSGTNPYLRGLVGMPNGIMAGFFDNTVAFCEPYVPYAWPVGYQISTEHPIVGLGVFGQTLFVGTMGNPYFISGADSASMSAQKLDSTQACVSRRSIAAVQGGVLFASPDGLCAADANGVTVVSAGIYTREDWQALNPASMFGADHENICYLFYNNGMPGCLTFDLSAKKLGRIELQATAAFVDRITDTMYLAYGTSITALFGGATRRTGKWKSGKATLPKQSSFAWLKVMGDQTPSTPVTVRWTRDGGTPYTVAVTSIQPVRLPAGIYLEHEIEIESQARITSLVMTSSTQELQAI